jgi:hypothetical protein
MSFNFNNTFMLLSKNSFSDELKNDKDLLKDIQKQV